MATGAMIGVAAYGVYSSDKASKDASKNAKAQAAAMERASQREYDLGMQQLAYQMELRDEWNSIYGDTLENLSQYYEELTPDSFAAQQVNYLQQSYESSARELDKQLAQRGISDSAVSAVALTELQGQRMMGAATARAQADQNVISQKQSFLNLGIGQKASYDQGLSNAYQNLQNIETNKYNTAANLQASYEAQSAAAQANIGTTIGSAIGNIAMINAMSTPSSTTATTSSTTSSPYVAGDIYSQTNYIDPEYMSEW